MGYEICSKNCTEICLKTGETVGLEPEAEISKELGEKMVLGIGADIETEIGVLA